MRSLLKSRVLSADTVECTHFLFLSLAQCKAMHRYTKQMIDRRVKKGDDFVDETALIGTQVVALIGGVALEEVRHWQWASRFQMLGQAQCLFLVLLSVDADIELSAAPPA